MEPEAPACARPGLKVLAPGLLPQQQLRQLVSGMTGCLSALRPRQPEMSVLRTGVGLNDSYIRQQGRQHPARDPRAGATPGAAPAAERGDIDAAFNLGGLRLERNDLAGAEAAFRQTDEGGHASVAANLGVLSSSAATGRRGKPLTARRPAGRRDRALSLGALLTGGNDTAGAEAAYRRAAERGGPVVAATLGAVHRQRSQPG